MFYRGKILFRNGKLATSRNCCCNLGPCYKYCFYVQGSVVGHPNEPGVSPPLTHPFSSRDARIVYHGHYKDTDSEPNGSFYHTHLWMIEFCITPTFNKPADSIAIEYYISLEQWVNDVLYPAWTGSPPGPGGGGDTAGEMSCSLSALNEKKSEFFVSPADGGFSEDLLGPLEFDGCEECEG